MTVFQISLLEVRRAFTDRGDASPLPSAAVVLALVDAVEAARDLERDAEPHDLDEDGHESYVVSEDVFANLAAELARFDFARPAGPS